MFEPVKNCIMIFPHNFSSGPVEQTVKQPHPVSWCLCSNLVTPTYSGLTSNMLTVILYGLVSYHILLLHISSIMFRFFTIILVFVSSSFCVFTLWKLSSVLGIKSSDDPCQQSIQISFCLICQPPITRLKKGWSLLTYWFSTTEPYWIDGWINYSCLPASSVCT